MSRRGTPGLVNEVRSRTNFCRTAILVGVLWLFVATLSNGQAQEPAALKEAGMLVAPEVQAPNSGLKQKVALEHLAFSPDGKELFGGGNLAGVVWHVKEQKVLTAQGVPVHHPAYTKDGKKRLAYAGIPDPNPSMGLKGTGFVTWDPKGKGELGKRLTAAITPLPKGITFPTLDVTVGESPEGLVFSPDGKTAISPPVYQWTPKGKPVPANFQLRVYDVARGVELRAFTLKHAGRIRCLARSPDGKFVVSGSDDGTARVWDVATGKEVAVFKRHAGGVGAVAFAPDGLSIASAGHFYPNRQKKDGKLGEFVVYVWEAKTGMEVTRFAAHPSPVSSLVFTPDGQRVLSLSSFPKGTFAVLWAAATGKEIGRTQLRAWTMAMGPDGLVATTDPQVAGVVQLWHLP